MLSIIIGILIFVGIILLLRGPFLGLVLGSVLLATAANVIVFSVSNPLFNGLSFVSTASMVSQNANDPLPQALTLTAIVIGFAIVSFLTVLIYKLHQNGESHCISDVWEEEAGE